MYVGCISGFVYSVRVHANTGSQNLESGLVCVLRCGREADLKIKVLGFQRLDTVVLHHVARDGCSSTFNKPLQRCLLHTCQVQCDSIILLDCMFLFFFFCIFLSAKAAFTKDSGLFLA